MPRVPTYDNTQVAPVAQPQTRVAATPAPNFQGAQQQQIGEGLQRLGSDLNSIAQDIQRRTDQVRLDAASNALIQAETEFELEMRDIRGRDALEREKALPDEFMERYQQRASEIEESLGNVRQREEFRHFVSQRSASFDQRLMEHMVAQQKVLESETRKATIETATQRAGLLWGDAEAVQESTDAVRTTVMRQLEDEGLASDKEIAAARMVSALSPLHAGVLRGQIDSGRLDMAKEYYSNHSAEMTLQDRANAQNAIQRREVSDGSLRRLLDYQAKGMSLKEARADLNQQFLAGDLSAEERDATVQRLEQEEAKSKANKTEYRNNLQGAYQTFFLNNPNATIYDMPANMQAALADEGMLAEAISFAKNGRYMTDPKAWTDFITKPRSELAGMTVAEYHNKYRGRLDNTHFERGLEMIKSAQDPGGTLSQADMIKNGAYRAAGVELGAKLDAKDKERVAMFEEDLNRRVQEYLAGKPVGAKLTNDELQSIVTQAQMDTVKVGGFFSDTQRPVGALRSNELEDAFVVVQDGREVQLAFIPQDYRDDAAARIRAAGMPVTEQLIAEMWAVDNPAGDQ